MLIVVEAYDEKLELASRNLPASTVLPVTAVDPVSLVRHEQRARDGRCRAHARGEAGMSSKERLMHGAGRAARLREDRARDAEQGNQYRVPRARATRPSPRSRRPSS